MATLQRTLEDNLKESVERWLKQREKEPQVFGPPGTLAYVLARKFISSIRLAKRQGFISGALQYRDNSYWDQKEIEEAASDFASEDFD